MKKKVIIIVATVILVPALLIGGFFCWQYNQGYHEANVEAGVSLTPQSFLKSPDETAVYAPGSDVFDTRIPGDYNVIVKTQFFTHKCLLHVQDTIAPTGQATDVTIQYGDTVNPDDFIKNISDATEVTVAFVAEPDYSKAGEQAVSLSLTDLGGNSAFLNANLYITYVKKEITVEAGSEVPSISDFLLGQCDASFATDLSKKDFSKVADSIVKIKVSGITYNCIMHITDTTPPEFNVADVSAYTGGTVSPDSFVTDYDDISEVTFSYEKEPDFELEGEQTVSVKATDESGNEAVKEAKLTLTQDTVPPVISGSSTINTLKGRSISYKSSVRVTDNDPRGATLTVDDSALNLQEAGTYSVTLTATDPSGNSTSKVIRVVVYEKEYTAAMAYSLADAALAKILTPGMTQYEQCYAIFKYVRSYLTFYGGHSVKNTWEQGAVDAFLDKTGDCFMYACMSKALLDEAGIPNYLVQRLPGARDTTHYWNLVNADGNGWYHFDTLPMKDGTSFFMWTKAQIDEYDQKVAGYHAYDTSLYPESN